MNQEKEQLVDKDKFLQHMLATNKLGNFFGVSQEVFDTVWSNLTSPEGNSVTYITMEIGSDPDVFNPIKEKLLKMDITGSTNPTLDYFTQKYLNGPEKIPNYGGGLGILAGDTLKSYADNRIPAIAISLLYSKGYFSQIVDAQLGQIAWSREWEPQNTPGLYLLNDPNTPGQPLIVEVPFYDRRDTVIMARAQVWMKMEINRDLDFFVPEVLLDYSIPSCPDWIRQAALNLYDSSTERSKVIQRRLLGSGITPVMEALGITSRTIHLNEQHGVVVVLHLIAEKLRAKLGDDYPLISRDEDILEAADQVAKRVVYTIHTPVKAGHDRFDKGLYVDIGHSFCQRILHLLARDEDFPHVFNFTAMAMKVNRATNAVSRLHKDVTKKQFPQYADKITAVTNGVHHLTWVSEVKTELYNSIPELKGWEQDPSVFIKLRNIKDDQKLKTCFEQAWKKDNEKLITYINRMLIQHRNQMHETWIDPPNYLSYLDEKEGFLESNVYTLGFARRFSTYKRADLIFEDLDTLASIITKNNYPVNFVFAGKAHPADEPGKKLIKQILATQKSLYKKTGGLARLVFVPGYDMAIAKMMVAGVHAWLNSPKRPLEASGTSGMKAAMNGVPNISIMDGWWVEGYHDGLTGWKFGYENPVDESSLSEDHHTLLYAEDSDAFYRLFPDILDMFYRPERREEYIDKSIMNLVLNAPIFNTHRMAAEYMERYDLDLAPECQDLMKKFAGLYQSEI